MKPSFICGHFLMKDGFSMTLHPHQILDHEEDRHRAHHNQEDVEDHPLARHLFFLLCVFHVMTP